VVGELPDAARAELDGCRVVQVAAGNRHVLVLR
jgi:hypothetical protein